jgi:flavin-dependent dehydrogenase
LTRPGVRDALVLGGGPAGLLVSRALSGIGVRVTLFREGEGASRGPGHPARSHVHVLPDSTLALLETLVPGIGSELRKRFGGRRPDRVELERVLGDRCLSSVHRVVVGRIRSVQWPPANADGVSTGQAGCVGPDGASVSADLLVDATGIRRVSFGAVARAMRRPVPMDEAAGTTRYTSIRLRGVEVSTREGFLAARDASSGCGALLLSLGDGGARLTVVTPSSLELDDAGAMAGVLREPGLREIGSICAAGVPEGGVARWGPHPVVRVVLEACEDAPPGWFPVGDAALVTPPHLARGIGQAAEQVSLLVEGVVDGTPLPAVRARIAERTRLRWLDSVVMESLGALPRALS